MQTELRPSRGVIAVPVIVAFVLVNAIGLSVFRALAGDWTGWPRLLALGVLGYGAYLLVPLAIAALIVGRRRMWEALGLTASPWTGLALAAACTSVVLLWAALTAPPSPPDRLAMDFVRSALLPGIAEEILFRAFLFGFLFRFAGWGFLPAALLSSLVFGVEHLYQGADTAEALGVAAITAVGGVWWSWLLAEWRWNLWVPAAFHVLLNAWFVAFEVADNALGSAGFVAVRLACIALSVAVTLLVARRRGGRTVKGRRWLRG